MVRHDKNQSVKYKRKNISNSNSFSFVFVKFYSFTIFCGSIVAPYFIFVFPFLFKDIYFVMQCKSISRWWKEVVYIHAIFAKIGLILHSTSSMRQTLKSNSRQMVHETRLLTISSFYNLNHSYKSNENALKSIVNFLLLGIILINKYSNILL